MYYLNIYNFCTKNKWKVRETRMWRTILSPRSKPRPKPKPRSKQRQKPRLRLRPRLTSADWTWPRPNQDWVYNNKTKTNTAIALVLADCSPLHYPYHTFREPYQKLKIIVPTTERISSIILFTVFTCYKTAINNFCICTQCIRYTI